MIYINKNTYTTNILELTAISSLLNPYYLFELKNDFNKTLMYFHCADESPYKCRFNEFNICETGSTSTILSGGCISLIPGGYTYRIFEASAVTLSISGTTTKVIDTGKAFVDGININLNNIYK